MSYYSIFLLSDFQSGSWYMPNVFNVRGIAHGLSCRSYYSLIAIRYCSFAQRQHGADYVSPDDMLSELWEDDDALAAHFRADHMATYRAGISNLRVHRRTVRRYDVTNAKDL